VKALWTATDRAAAVIALVTALGTATIWILTKSNAISTTLIKVDRTGALITVLSLTAVGAIFILSGLATRYNRFAVFDPGRGRGGTALLLLGSLFLAVAIAGLILF
jgi:hypothetical protein